MSYLGDWWLLIINDIKQINLQLTEQQIVELSAKSYKKLVRNLIRKAAFAEYVRKQSEMLKIKNLKYKNLEPQQYL